MSLLSSSIALTMYKLDAPSAITAEKLKQFAFRSIDDIPETKAWGWTSIENMFDCEWRESVPEKGQFMCFAFRVDTRKVASAVIRKHLAEAFKEEEAKNRADGKAFISRARKKELKEQHTAKLLKRAEPVPVSVDLALDTTSGLLYVGTTSGTMLERIEEQLATSFGVSPVRMVLAGLEDRHDADDQALEILFRNIHESVQSVSVDGGSFTVSAAERITLTGHSEVAVKSAAPENRGTADASIDAGLQAGLFISKMQIRIEQDQEALTWEMVVDREFGFSGLKTPHVDKPDSDADPDAVLLEKLYLIDRAVQVMHALFRKQVGD